ncbi:hypothetical protein MCOR25_001644 [Pyricularia grisea]|uniref:Dolichyl-diphosphooligosaccharide--protein glycosyltransferase subunit 4 n=1 Tax=Pyricularia grisea TaxID=148305 RepID=A0A6P8B796_PYRGI|nr:hypothetical protein PgNI_05726 [Pyricularia grisea]KAI6380453.1 hypothetical protein MCOR25_001644 [Pyricularia grisea]TLD11187.1 hypothetical protein PgNI_05726 [Pyricularia grisea]
MISDDDLYKLAVFLGSAAMVLIVIYHFVEVNTTDEAAEKAQRTSAPAGKQAALNYGLVLWLSGNDESRYESNEWGLIQGI